MIARVAGVDRNNNASERQLRDDALARKTCRASKTAQGAKRRSIISSVLQSIGKQLQTFTLESAVDEANRWLAKGQSCIQAQIEARGLSPPEASDLADNRSLLDRVVLAADG